MKKESDNNHSKSIKDSNDSTQNRSSSNRRAALKKLLASGAVVTASQSVPEKWAKPVVDSVLLPAHAQTSETPEMGTILGRWILGDDAPGGADTGMTSSTTNSDAGFLYDDGTQSDISARLSPPASGVPISLDISVSGTTFTGFDTAPSDSVPSTGAGTANFLDNTSVANGDFGDTPGTGSITLTFSAPGYASSIIALTIV